MDENIILILIGGTVIITFTCLLFVYQRVKQEKKKQSFLDKIKL